MSKVSTERRVHARHAAEFELEGTHAARGTVARMVARNLSLGGLYCTSSIGFEEMTCLSIRLSLPARTVGSGNDKSLDVEGVVVRRRKLNPPHDGERYELAIFFPNLSEPQRERITDFLSR